MEAVIPKNHLEDVGVVGVLRVVEVGEPHPRTRAVVDGTGLPDRAKLAQELVTKHDTPVAILVHGDGAAVGRGALVSRRSRRRLVGRRHGIVWGGTPADDCAESKLALVALLPAG